MKLFSNCAPAFFGLNLRSGPVLPAALGALLLVGAGFHFYRFPSGPPVVRTLPSAPQRVVEVRAEPDRPQPRRLCDAGSGMTSVVGQVREAPLFDVKFVVLSHNTVRGAAGGSLLNAELIVSQGLIQ